MLDKMAMTAKAEGVVSTFRSALIRAIEHSDDCDGPPDMDESNAAMQDVIDAFDTAGQLVEFLRAAHRFGLSAAADAAQRVVAALDRVPGPVPDGEPSAAPQQSCCPSGGAPDGQLSGLTPTQQSEAFVNAADRAVRDEQDPAEFATWLINWIGPINLSEAITTVGIDTLSELMIKEPLTLTKEAKEYLAVVWNEASRQLRARGLTI